MNISAFIFIYVFNDKTPQYIKWSENVCDTGLGKTKIVSYYS